VRGAACEGRPSRDRNAQRRANHGLFVLAKALTGASGSLALGQIQKKIAAAATGDILSPPGKQNGNSPQGLFEDTLKFQSSRYDH
jgi:hypothetical protein